jgi:FkbM family methyltransferase
MTESLSVIVPTYHRPEHLHRCLKGLARQERQPDEILVVCRIGDDESSAVCEQFAGGAPVRVVCIDRPGQVAALNAGREAANGSILAMTDDDAEPTPEWLARIERHFGDPIVGAVGGRDVVFESGRPVEHRPVSRVGRVQWFGRAVGRHHHPSHCQEVHFLKGANMAFRAQALEPFDPRLWGRGAQVCNDLEASLSVRARGWRVLFDPRLEVYHHPAPRHDEDARRGPSLRAMQAGAHNELYALLLHVPAWQRFIVSTYALAIGHSKAPGGVRAIVRAVLAPRTTHLTLRQATALTSCRVMAVRRAARVRRHRSSSAGEPIIAPVPGTQRGPFASTKRDYWLKRLNKFSNEPPRGAMNRVARRAASAVWITGFYTAHPLGRSRPVRTAARLWAWQIWRRTVRRTVQVELPLGALLSCPPWSNMAGAWVSVGLHEAGEMAFAMRFLRRGDLFVDVGANIGVYSVLALRTGASVVAFDPTERARDVLSRNLARNGPPERIEVRPCALSEQPGVARFRIDLESSNLLVGSGDQAPTIDVAVSTLDAELDQRAPAVIKVDAEGFDAAVLRGGERLLREHHPAIIVEVWDGGWDVRGVLESHGYRFFRHDLETGELVRMRDGFHGEGYLIAVHPSKDDETAARLASTSGLSTAVRRAPIVRWIRHKRCAN